METTAFGASTAMGMFVGNAVVASMLGVAMFATPVGWVFAIGIGLAAGYTAAKIGDRIGKNVSATLYDTSANFY
ncbi:MAG: hypothetical protein HRU20_26975 [Pseudomonadales bacterium]|nr:hypothetical protein [Pseudomonadales bacterium]